MFIKKSFFGLIILIFCWSPINGQDIITTGILLDEMTNLKRLTHLPEHSYRMIQFSSFDRRSQVPGQEGWFANSDGFGNEPIPGFENILKKPDPNGIGTYLICDVEGPGAILRLWSAGISGKIRFYLDNIDTPVYEGEAIDFFHDTAAKISGLKNELTSTDVIRQFDATYFPIPFSNRCRIEWIGNIKEIHFYQIGIRIYDKNTKVITFNPEDIFEYTRRLKEVKVLLNKENLTHGEIKSDVENLNLKLPGNSVMELIKIEGTKAIDFFSLKISAKDLEEALRTTIINIHFDHAVIPQVQSPIGDFFGAAPGLNPYQSYPFTVLDDSTLVCRFIMPFQNSARIEIENLSNVSVNLGGNIHFVDYDWKDGHSMHFRAKWKNNQGLTASDTSIVDIPYILAMGKGRIVGTAAFLYNPSKAVTSWGNWWGEGDEKIFVDSDTFPSIF
ncbi:MAG: DUF2961 domain-containing protein, partial [Cyclobacteriaceae bacterium]|nr:DUF2961 domain-containing protein [Cyclobacteriaceae bacterium]